jgi:uncharacterized protein (DUF1501 family)
MHYLNRRQFLKSAYLVSLAGLLPSANSWAYSSGSAGSNSNKLIVIMLRGAVDGLSVVAPYGDNLYYALRPTIALAKPGNDAGVLDLDGHFGMNPAMEPLLPFWRSKGLGFVVASGSPDPTRSHFDAQDYMETGVPGGKMMTSGWLNRLVQEIPSNDSPVQALNLGAIMPRIFAGTGKVGSASRNLNDNKLVLDKPIIGDYFSQLYRDEGTDLGQAFAEGMAAHKTIENALSESTGPSDQSMTNGANGGPSASALVSEQKAASRGAPSPKNYNNFGSQLGRLMTRDPSIQIAFTDFGGWDTHVNQGNGRGQLANKLRPLSEGLAELAQSLGPLYGRTTIMVMSEFGRTVKENGNNGTDHGHGNVIWLMGGPVAGGKVYGRWSNLAPNNLYEGRDVPATTDFRDVICYVLGNHMAVSRRSLANIFPDFNMSNRPLVNA